MSDDPNPEDKPSQAEAEVSASEIAQRLSDFESRILAGEFDNGSFHRAVQRELFPLLGGGRLEPSAFARLVDLWAQRNHPFDWHPKPFGLS